MPRWDLYNQGTFDIIVSFEAIIALTNSWKNQHLNQSKAGNGGLHLENLIANSLIINEIKGFPLPVAKGEGNLLKCCAAMIYVSGGGRGSGIQGHQGVAVVVLSSVSARSSTVLTSLTSRNRRCQQTKYNGETNCDVIFHLYFLYIVQKIENKFSHATHPGNRSFAEGC